MNFNGIDVNYGRFIESEHGAAQAEAPAQTGSNKNSAAQLAVFSGPVLSAHGFDIEEIAQLYIAQLREDEAAARSVAQIKQKLIKMEGEKIVSTMKQQAKKLLASGIFQGVVSIAASIATAVSAGTSVALSSGVNAAASGVTRAVTSSAVKQAVLKASPQLVRAVSHFDPYKIQVEKKGFERQRLANSKQQAEMSLNITNDHLQTAAQMRRRVSQILERCGQIQEEGRKIAGAPLKG